MYKIFAKFKGVGSRLFRIPVTQTSFSCHGNLTVVTNNPPLKGAGVERGGGEGGVVLQLLIASLLLEKLHVIDL